MKPYYLVIVLLFFLIILVLAVPCRVRADPRQCANEPSASRRAICTECERYAVEKFKYIFHQGCARSDQTALTDACRAAIDRWVDAASKQKDTCIAAFPKERPPRAHPISREESEAPPAQEAPPFPQ